MHVVFRESHGLDEADTPIDLGQSPADLVVLSFSDSDLGAFAAGWHRSNGDLPTLRLANHGRRRWYRPTARPACWRFTIAPTTAS